MILTAVNTLSSMCNSMSSLHSGLLLPLLWPEIWLLNSGKERKNKKKSFRREILAPSFRVAYVCQKAFHKVAFHTVALIKTRLPDIVLFKWKKKSFKNNSFFTDYIIYMQDSIKLQPNKVLQLQLCLLQEMSKYQL